MRTQGYIFYIDKVLLPVAPSSVNISHKNMNSIINLINDAEFNMLKQEGLQEISFKFMLPSQRYPFARYLGFYQKPSYFLNKLKNLKKRAKPFQLIIIRNYPNSAQAYFNTNLKVSLEDFSVEENAEEGMDVYVEIKLKEFIDPRPKQYIANADGTVSTQNQRWTDKVESRIKEMKYGDKIWQVIRRETGGLDQLETVMEINGISSLTGFVTDKLRLW
jgi:hypothetical protein|nr:MAG TPA: tail assembly protein [Caudoviricetes sp.]